MTGENPTPREPLVRPSDEQLEATGDALLAQLTEALRGIIRQQPDDVARAVAAHVIAVRWRELAAAVAQERREAWGTLRAQGWTRKDLEVWMKVSPSRIGQILDGIDRKDTHT